MAKLSWFKVLTKKKKFKRKYGFKNSLVKGRQSFWFISIPEHTVLSHKVLEEGTPSMDL